MNLPTIGWLCKALQTSLPTALDHSEELGAISIDSRTLQPGNVFWALAAHRNGHDYVGDAFAKGAKAAVVRKEWQESAAAVVRNRLIGVENTNHDLQKAARAWRETLECPVIGITGTNGKTSTKDLIRRLLSLKAKTAGTEGNFNNEIGVPLTVLSVSRDSEFAVIEMGASHHGDIRFLCEIAKPTHGLVTSIGKAHLEGFGSLEALTGTKGELYDFVSESGVAFVPTDDKLCREESAVCRHRIGFGFQFPVAGWNSELYSGANLRFDDHGCGRFVFEGVDIRLSIPGRPAALSALAALTAARHFGISPTECRDTVLHWNGVHGRTSVEVVGAILLMDDSYNANPDSMRAALETLSMLRGSRKTVVLGDMNELGDTAANEHRELARQLPNFGITYAIFVGKFAGLAVDEAKVHGVQAQAFASGDELVGELASLIRSGDTVLVKGSRSNQLERIVDQLKRLFG